MKQEKTNASINNVHECEISLLENNIKGKLTKKDAQSKKKQ